MYTIINCVCNNAQIGAVTDDVETIMPKMRMWQYDLRLDENCEGSGQVRNVLYCLL